MHLFQPIQRTLGARRRLILSLALTCLVGLGALTSIAAQTQPAQPTQPPFPTLPPLPTIPPQPTQPPLPTVPPVNTVPPQPTQQPPPTVPPVPTEAPTTVPTEAPTEAPTPEPTAPPPTSPPAPPPPPAPTRAPATETADEATIDCDLATDRDAATPAATPIAAESAWTLYTCTLDLNFGPVDTLAIRGETETPGWQVILVDRDAPNTPGLLDASNSRLELDGLEGERTATFLIGVQPSCTAFKAATIDLDLTATRPGPDGATVETTAAIPLTAPSEPPPAVTLEALTLTDDGDATLAAIDLRYANAPSRCGWQLLVTLGPASDDAIAIDSLDAPEGATATIANSAISILIPARIDDVSDGRLRIDTRLESPGNAIAIETISLEAVTFP